MQKQREEKETDRRQLDQGVKQEVKRRNEGGKSLVKCGGKSHK